MIPSHTAQFRKHDIKRKKCSSFAAFFFNLSACIWCMRERNEERSYIGDVVWSSLIGASWNYMWRRWNWGSPSLEVEQVKQQKKNDGEEDRNWKYESLVKFKLKFLRIKMRGGWGLRETHQSPGFKIELVRKLMTSSVEVLYKRCKCLAECIYGGEEESWRWLRGGGKGYINKATFVNKIEASKLELLRSNLHDDSIYSHFFNDGTSPCCPLKHGSSHSHTDEHWRPVCLHSTSRDLKHYYEL